MHIYIYILSSVTWMQPIMKADGQPRFNAFHPPFWCAVFLWCFVQNDNESKSLALQFIEPSSNF